MESFEKISNDETYIKIGKFLDIEKLDKSHKEVINTVYNIFDKLQEKMKMKNTINEEPKESIFEINNKDYNLKKLILLQLNQCDFLNEKK